LPGYVDTAADLKSKGVDEIVCVSVNDAFVMAAWAQDQKAEGKVIFQIIIIIILQNILLIDRPILLRLLFL